MSGAEAFDGAAFLGLARDGRRDPYRLALFAQHLGLGERPLVFLTIPGGTLLVTDRRVLELRAHLEVHGAWNVKQFQGYEVRREVARSTIADVARRTSPSGAVLEDALLLTTPAGTEAIVLSRGPEVPLTAGEFNVLRAAILGPQAK